MHIAPTKFAFTVLLGLFAALPALSIDMSAPTLVLLPAALDTSILVAGLTLALFMVGFAAGQLSGGLASDRLGRRPVLLVALACYTAAGLACSLSGTGYMLVAARFLQGLGAGACSVQAFAMVQDLFEGAEARAKRSYVTVVFGAVPVIAPGIGSVVSDLAGWRSVHAVLAIGGAALLLMAWLRVGESRWARPARSGAAVAPVPMWRDWPFVGFAAANALSYGCIFAYIAGSPIVIMNQLGFSSTTFAAVFATTALGLTFGAWVSGRLGRRGIAAAALLGPSLVAASAAALGLYAAAASAIVSGVVLLPMLLVVVFTRGIIAPNLQQIAIERRQDHAGAASAVIGVSQLLSGAIAAGVVALLSAGGATGVAVSMALFSTAALIAWLLTVRRPRGGPA